MKQIATHTNHVTYHHQQFISKFDLSRLKGKSLKQQIQIMKNNLLQLKQWNLSNKVCSRQLLDRIFDQKDYLNRVQSLSVHWNQYSNIIENMNIDYMINIKFLNIGGNNIVSIQMLSRSNLANLQQLWLWNNKLTNLNSLRKCNLPHLRLLDLSQNRILQCSKLSQINISRLSKINLQNNILTNIDYFIKIMFISGEFKVLFMDNSLVKAYGKLVKGKKGRRGCIEVIYDCKGKIPLRLL